MNNLLRWCLRLFLAALLALGLGYLPYRAYGPSGLARAMRMQDELERLEQQNEELKQKNHALKRQVESLRKDRDAVEQVARDELGLLRPDDVVFLFE